MRHLTALQKIAQLETRIAELEKQAIFGRKETIESTLGDLPVYEVIYVPSPDKDIDKRGLRGVDAIRYLMEVAPQSTVNEGLPYSIEYTNGAVWLNRGNLSVAVIRLMEKYKFKVSKEASLNSFKDMANALKKAFRVSSVKKTAGFFGLFNSPLTLEKEVEDRDRFYEVIDNKGNTVKQDLTMGEAIKIALGCFKKQPRPFDFEIVHSDKGAVIRTVERQVIYCSVNISQTRYVFASEEAHIGSFKQIAMELGKQLKTKNVHSKQAGFFGPSPYEKTISKLPYPYLIRVRNGFDPSSLWQPEEGQEGAIYKAIDDLHAQKALQGGVLELSDAKAGFGFVLENKGLSYPPYIMWVTPSKQMISVTGNIYTDSLTQHKTHMKALKERVGKYLNRKGYKVKVI